MPQHEPSMHSHEKLMRRAIELAKRGRGGAEPNPLVGCVLLKSGRIISEGFHARFGGPHAEAAALLACPEDPAGATAIVTLEPCCHLNKKTPPCVPALIHAGIHEVIVGTLDPNPAVSGGGVAQLRAAGLIVQTGVLEAPCRQVLAPWLATLQHQRPYVTLKWAQSADGLVAGAAGRRVRISGPAAHRAIHELRAKCDVIMVGVNTVLLDDPLLTARDVAAARPLLRVVLDRQLRTPPGCALVKTAAQHPTRIYCSESAAATPAAEALRSAGVAVESAPLCDARIDLPFVLAGLRRSGCTHLLVECGPTLAATFISRNLADRAWVVSSPSALSESSAPRAPVMPWPATSSVSLAADTLREHLNPASPVFFAPEASADLPGPL